MTIESNHTIEIDSFVRAVEIAFVPSAAIVLSCPNEPVGREAFVVIRDAMRGKDMVALGRIVLAKRERVLMLQPWDKGLVGTTLRYPYEVRDTKRLLQEDETAPASKVVSLMDALKRSLATEAANAAEQPRGKAKKPKKRTAGQRAKCCYRLQQGTAKEKSKEPIKPATRQRKAGWATPPKQLLRRESRSRLSLYQKSEGPLASRPSSESP